MVMTGTSCMHLRPRLSHIASPTECASGTNPGNEVATLATSRISMGPAARRLAMAKDMAMR